MRSVFYFFLLIISIIGLITAETYIPPGDVFGVWTAGGSPYYIDGEINVPTDNMLLIEPGCSLIFTGHYKFCIDSNAVLQAIGAEDCPIVITAQEHGIGRDKIEFYKSSPTCELTYCVIESGKDDVPDYIGGAGIYCFRSNITIFHSSFIDNIAGNDFGGGLYLVESKAVVSYCIFENNEAFCGGAIACLNDSSWIFENEIFDNHALSFGGGIHVSSSADSIFNNYFFSNIADVAGGAVSCTTSTDATFVNNVLAQNEANYGGGFHFQFSLPTITNCTIARNQAAYNGGGMCVESGSKAIIFNSIFYGNYSTDNDDIYVPDWFPGNPCTLYIGYSDIDPAKCITEGNNAIIWGPQNLIDNPQFLDDDTTGGIDFHLSDESLCIDSGAESLYADIWDTVVYAPATDLDDIARPYGFDWDMGAYENTSPSFFDIFIEPCGQQACIQWDAIDGVEAYLIYSGLDPILLARIDSTADAPPYYDTPYPSDTIYYYQVIALNSVGDTMGFSAITSVETYRYKVHGFSMTQINNNQIELSWLSASIDSEFMITYSSGFIFPAFGSIAAIVSAPTCSWISLPGMFLPGSTYTCAIYNLADCGYMDSTARVALSFTMVDTNYESVCRKVSIVHPEPGCIVSGNAVQLLAKSACPAESLMNIDHVIFQKTYEPFSVWLDIDNLSPLDLLNYNPDWDAPYYINWNTMDLVEGEYFLRGIAHDTLLVYSLETTTMLPDSQASNVSIIINHSNPEYRCSLYYSTPLSAYIIEVNYNVNPNQNYNILIMGLDATENQIYIPEGTVCGNDVLIFRLIEEDEEVRKRYMACESCVIDSIGEFYEFGLQSGITYLSTPLEAAFEYPDFDDNGIVDGTSCPEDSLWLFHFDGSEWDSVSCTIDFIENTIVASISNLGKYAVLCNTAMKIENTPHDEKVSLSLKPSPFNSSVEISYNLNSAGDVVLDIYDIAGHIVASPVKHKQEAGSHTAVWTAPEDMPSGIYFVRLKTDDCEITKRAILLK